MLDPDQLGRSSIWEYWNDGSKHEPIQYTLLYSPTQYSNLPVFQHSMSGAPGKHSSIIS